MSEIVFNGKKRFIIPQLLITLFFIFGGMGCMVLVFMMPKGFFVLLLAAAVSIYMGYYFFKRIIRSVTISDNGLYQEGIYSDFDVSVLPDEVDFWIEEYNERVEYGVTENVVMLIKDNTIVHRINTRMIHDVDKFKKVLPWPYNGEYKRDIMESMWLSNTIKGENIVKVSMDAS